MRPDYARSVLVLVFAAQAIGLTWASHADDFPPAEHGRYVAQVADEGEFVAVEPSATVSRGALQVAVGRAGKVQIDTGAGSYTIESCFTYPGLAEGAPKIGWNGLPHGFSQDNYPDVTTQLGSEDAWGPRVQERSADSITVEAEGACYRLLRTLKVGEARIDVTDTFTNLRDVPTAIVPRHRFTSQGDYRSRFSVNLEVAANATVYLQGPADALGIVMQDNLSRLRMRPWIPESGNRAGFQVLRTVLDVGKTHTFAWSVYVLAPEEDYFSFVNRVRRDWNANFTIRGPFCFAYLKPEGDDIKFYLLYGGKEFYLNGVMEDPRELREYFQWRGSRIIALSPRPDHEPGALDHVVTWDEYRDLMGRALPALRKAAPDVRFIGCIETDWVAIDPATIKDGDKIPLAPQDRKYGPSIIKTLTLEQSKIVEDSRPEWRDSLVKDLKGCLRIYHYYRGGAPINTPPLNVYPEVGNARYEYMLGQLKLVLDEVGLDGVYYDEFPMSQLGSVRTYGGAWDGASADVDFRTGKLHDKYKDCSLASLQARLNLIDYPLSRGKIVVANRYSTSREEQALPINRFTETNSVFSKLTWEDGAKPPAFNYCFFGHLNSPIGLGATNAPEGVAPERWLMQVLITYLRHGMVFYHYGPIEPPMTEENRDVFGVIKHMFPITPMELGEGFIIAKERILTAISLERTWEKAGKPTVLLYDINGRPVDPAGRCEVKPDGDRWRVALRLNDWSEIAIVE